MIKTFLFLCLLTTVVQSIYGQTGKILKKGDEFFVETFANSGSLFQRGKQSLEINTNLYTGQLFTILNLTEDGYTIAVSTTKFADTINTLGKQGIYDSGTLTDTTSVICKAITKILASVDTIQVDKKGMIITTSSDSIHSFHDTLTPFTGINPPRFPKGSTIPPFAGFPLVSSEKDSNWPYTSTIENVKTFTEYKVVSDTDSLLTISFAAKTTGAYSNTNTNGIVVLDHLTGMVLQWRSQDVTLENEIINGHIYSKGTRTAKTIKSTFLSAAE